MKKIVFVSGRFNVIHPGHLRLLRFAKKLGDYLIVGLESDAMANNEAYVSETLRLDGLKSNIWVDKVILIKDSISKTINKIKPHIIVKGKEHEKKFNIEKKIVESYGGKLFFSSGDNVFSSLDIIKKEINQSSINTINFPKKYIKRHNIKSNSLKKILNNFSKLKVCVIGDIIVDEYITCEPIGMSQEDPTIVVTPIDKSKFLGGAGIVAAHVAGLGADVDLYSVTGNDLLSKFIKQKIKKYKINPFIYKDESRQTSYKQKFRSSDRAIFKVNQLQQTPINKSFQNIIFKTILKKIKKYDLILLSDFNYGVLAQDLVDKIINLSKRKKVIICADSQSSSQIGNISRFHDVNLLTPTEREARLSIQNNEDGLIVLVEKLRKKSKAKKILLKLGQEGILIHTGNLKKNNKILTDRIGPMNLHPKDISGAGDCLLVASSLSEVSEANIWETAFLGSLASAIQVSRTGNIPLQFKELLKEINQIDI
ncbi:PfkB family carbohydrate kinase [Candidatus Pelagibacter sp.]|nr:PfkB family carbohydrate kinase [Candidatus Pelagibacter sp.]